MTPIMIMLSFCIPFGGQRDDRYLVPFQYLKQTIQQSNVQDSPELLYYYLNLTEDMRNALDITDCVLLHQAWCLYVLTDTVFVTPILLMHWRQTCLDKRVFSLSHLKRLNGRRYQDARNYSKCEHKSTVLSLCTFTSSSTSKTPP